MRSILLTVLCAASITMAGCQSVDDLPTEQRQALAVHQVDGKTKAQIYAAAMKWFVATFRDSKSVLEIKDQDGGTLMGKIVIPNGIHDALGVPFDLQTTMTVDIKDGRYRTTFDGYRFLSGYNDRALSPGAEFDSARKSVAKVDADLAAAIAAPVKDF